MEKSNSRVCGICGRHFSSGKAMGGHMRSHLAKLPIPPKPETKKQALENYADLTQSPIQSASSLPYHPKKKHTQNFRSLKRNFFASSANSNTENESESYPKNPTGKRSKCHRKRITAADTNAEPKQLSSIPETLHAEEAARLLLLISKSNWPDGDGRDDPLDQTNTQAGFICERCGKKFRTHQALGGHKASHKKTKC